MQAGVLSRSPHPAPPGPHPSAPHSIPPAGAAGGARPSAASRPQPRRSRCTPGSGFGVLHRRQGFEAGTCGMGAAGHCWQPAARHAGAAFPAHKHVNAPCCAAPPTPRGPGGSPAPAGCQPGGQRAQRQQQSEDGAKHTGSCSLAGCTPARICPALLPRLPPPRAALLPPQPELPSATGGTLIDSARFLS